MTTELERSREKESPEELGYQVIGDNVHFEVVFIRVSRSNTSSNSNIKQRLNTRVYNIIMFLTQLSFRHIHEVYKYISCNTTRIVNHVSCVPYYMTCTVCHVLQNTCYTLPVTNHALHSNSYVDVLHTTRYIVTAMWMCYIPRVT